MRSEPLGPPIPDEYDRWIALYFRNRLSSAYAELMAVEAPGDMAELLKRADNAHGEKAARLLDAQRRPAS